MHIYVTITSFLYYSMCMTSHLCLHLHSQHALIHRLAGWMGPWKFSFLRLYYLMHPPPPPPPPPPPLLDPAPIPIPPYMHACAHGHPLYNFIIFFRPPGLRRTTDEGKSGKNSPIIIDIFQTQKRFTI